MSISIRSIHKASLAALAAVALLGMTAYAADPVREDPAAVAVSLEKQAAELRASADKHDAMGKMHKAGAGSSKINHDGVVKHCDAIAKNLRAAAAESEALAAEYRKGQ